MRTKISTSCHVFKCNTYLSPWAFKIFLHWDLSHVLGAQNVRNAVVIHPPPHGLVQVYALHPLPLCCFIIKWRHQFISCDSKRIHHTLEALITTYSLPLAWAAEFTHMTLLSAALPLCPLKEPGIEPKQKKNKRLKNVFTPGPLSLRSGCAHRAVLALDQWDKLLESGQL